MRAAEIRISMLLLSAIGIVLGATYWLVMKHEVMTSWTVGRGAILVGGTSGCILLGIVAMLHDVRNHRRRVLDQARQWILAAGTGTMAIPKDAEIKPFIMPLRERITELATKAETLQVQKKNLEIQLRLADAQRRQSQIMIHGISDAVLITDEFDELLQANEAAGQLFSFNIVEAVRKPISQLLDASAAHV